MKVLQGREGWLFIDNDTNRVVDQHTGILSLSIERIQLWRETILRRIALAQRLSKSYYFLIAPDNHGIYPEYLPDSVTPALRRPVHDLIELFEDLGFEDYCYPLPALLDSKLLMTVGHQTDSHWSHYGAYCVYKEMIRTLNLRHPELEPLDVGRIHFDFKSAIGDLGAQMDPKLSGSTVFSRILKPKAKLVSDNHVNNRGNIQIFENENANLPTALIFRDSYGLWLRHFLAETFSRLILVATPLCEEDLIHEFDPDIIISEMAERFLISVPDDVEGERVSEIIASKM